MDIQVKRGLLDACVLSALCSGDSYGYKIIQDVSSVIEISESTLYPILKRLEAAGALRSYSVEHNGRLRKYYSITPAGHSKIDDYLADWEQLMRVYEFIRKGTAQ